MRPSSPESSSRMNKLISVEAGGFSGGCGTAFHIVQGFLLFSLDFQFQKTDQALKMLFDRYVSHILSTLL
jgi:hypothetical protein